jgi:hypothetical protein
VLGGVGSLHELGGGEGTGVDLLLLSPQAMLGVLGSHLRVEGRKVWYQIGSILDGFGIS